MAPNAMTTVDIKYCVPCGHLDRAVKTQRELLETFGQRLEGVQLTTGDGGVFRIHLDGELVWDKADDGYDLDAIVETIDGRISTEA